MTQDTDSANGDGDDLEKWREQTETGSRIEEEAREDEPTDHHEQVIEATAVALGEIEHGELSRTISFHDGAGKALIVGIEHTDEFERLTALLSAHESTEESVEPSKSAVLRALLRVGLNEVDPKLLAAGKAAKSRRSQESSF